MIDPARELRDFFTAALVTPVPRDHSETPEQLIHRRWVCAVALAVGSFMMAWTLQTVRISPADPVLYASTFALATTWVVGTLLSGRVYVGAGNRRTGVTSTHAVVQSFMLGLLLIAVFVGGASVVALIPVLNDPLLSLVTDVQMGILPLVVALFVLNAVAEELFFRGGLYAAIGGQHEVLITSAVYALSTVPTGIPVLVVGSAALGAAVGFQRRVTGGVLGPIITHLTWLAGMMLLLPQVLTSWH
ncbi:MAG: CPBP family intramembrane glutamic endopeptidase [Propionicimonas sp.]